MEVKITKYEPYPQDIPVGMAIGFQITSKTDRVFYRDVVVEHQEEIKNDEEYLQIAWEILKDEVETEVERLDQQHKILGAIWSPIKEAIEEPLEPDLMEDPVEEGEN